MSAIARLARHALAAVLAAAMVLAQPASAQGKAFSQAELDQMVAPVALYPDALLAQLLMASTYPLEVVTAARWVKANPKVTGKALEDALQKQPWDPSVKSLAPFPSVLAMMDEKIDWTQKLGDAFLGQRSEVMATVQSLRRKAYDTGNLKPGAEQKVVVEKTVIVIEPATTTVYVPVYNPTIVYGPWWHPTYVPYYYYPPSYRPGAAFATGVVVGAALWGGVNWRGNDVTINVNTYNQFNRTTINKASWEHDAAHRKGTPYRDPTVAQRYQAQRAVNDKRDAPAERRPDASPREADRPAAPNRAAPRDRPGPDDDGPDRPGKGGRDRGDRRG